MAQSAALKEVVDAAAPPRGVKQGRSHRLPAAFEQLESFPALTESRNRLLLALVAEHPSHGELIAAIEADIALVVAILRLANRVESSQRGRVFTIPQAVEVLTPDGVEMVARRIAVVEFFEHVPGWEVTPDEVRRHSVITQRVTDQLAFQAEPDARDELAVAALLHDVGKLVMGVAYVDYPESIGDGTPEERLRAEREGFGIDHAMAGGVLIRRWGLPDRLGAIVAAHHDPHASGAPAVLRLADLLVHYGHGRNVDPAEMVRAAAQAGVEHARLRTLMHEVPGSSSRQRAVDPCPLSKAELVALRGLADGKAYKEIALDLGRSASTIRTQVHSSYKKMGVRDRAQAVLLATEHGWL
jgi:putative nucleotidyltransferase with HDIG domain